jgi:hypothetical protein
METMIFILIPIFVAAALTGLGFVVYHHPKLGKNIINICMLVASIGMLLATAYNKGQSDLYRSIETAVLDDRSMLDSLDMDLKKLQKDSAFDKIEPHIEKATAVVRLQSTARERSYSEFRKGDNMIWNTYMWIGISIIILYIFMALANVFENMKNGNNNGSQEGTEGKPLQKSD